MPRNGSVAARASTSSARAHVRTPSTSIASPVDRQPIERLRDQPCTDHAPPAGDHVAARTREAHEEPRDHPRERVDRLAGIGSVGERDRSVEPGGRVHEGDVATVRRAEDQLAALSGRAQERAPARPELAGEDRIVQVAGDGIRQDGPGHRLVGQRVTDDPDQRLDLRFGHLDPAQPHVLAPTLARRGCNDEVREVVRGQQVERAPERPRLDDRAGVAEGVPHVCLAEAVDPGVRLELGGARDLGVEPDHRADDLDEPIGRGALGEVLALEAKGENARPVGRQRGWRRGGLRHAPIMPNWFDSRCQVPSRAVAAVSPIIRIDPPSPRTVHAPSASNDVRDLDSPPQQPRIRPSDVDPCAGRNDRRPARSSAVV